VGDYSCRQVADSAPAFALDILEPVARARVAAHLIRCPECRVTVTDMQDSAARLLDLGEPWTEEDLWADESSDVDARPPRRRLRIALSLAAATALLVGSTLGPELEQVGRRPVDPAASAVLLAAGRTVGTVRFYTGANAGVEVEVRGLPGNGSMSVVVVTREGTARSIGQLVVSRGQAGWFGADPIALTDIEGVVLLDAKRHQVASADLATSLT
jgi:hypothetical protein